MLVICAIACRDLYLRLNQQESILPSIALILILGILAFTLFSAKRIDFDPDFMYIIHGGTIQTIPLSDVIVLKMTMTSISEEKMWKVKYRDEKGDIKSVRFLPKYKQLDLFKKAVSMKNPTVEIKNWSHSFDFDQ